MKDKSIHRNQRGFTSLPIIPYNHYVCKTMIKYVKKLSGTGANRRHKRFPLKYYLKQITHYRVLESEDFQKPLFIRGSFQKLWLKLLLINIGLWYFIQKKTLIFNRDHVQILFDNIKSFNNQGFCKYVSPLMININELNISYTFLNIIFYKVVFYFNMLSSRMLNWILCQKNSSNIITKDRDTVSTNLIIL